MTAYHCFFYPTRGFPWCQWPGFESNKCLNTRIEKKKKKKKKFISEALPGVLGIQGEELFIFRDLGRRVIYFRGFGEKAGF